MSARFDSSPRFGVTVASPIGRAESRARVEAAVGRGGGSSGDSSQAATSTKITSPGISLATLTAPECAPDRVRRTMVCRAGETWAATGSTTGRSRIVLGDLLSQAESRPRAG